MRALLITRPEQEAKPLTEALAAKGFAVLSEPMLAIEPVADRQALNGALAKRPHGIIITSARALDVAVKLTDERHIPLFCVGEATARQARRQGFGRVQSGRTVHDLLAILKELQAAELLYLRGEDISADIAPELAKEGFSVDSVILYRARAATEFSASLQGALTRGAIQGALFFSRRTAEVYTRLSQSHGLEITHKAIQAVALSDTIAQALARLPWQCVHVAQQPDMEHMLAAAEEVF